MKKYMVGRQPIFDAKLDVRGYELLYRAAAGAPDPGGDAMTADVLVHAGLDLGLERLVGGKLAFVNATRSFLSGEQEVPFSPRQVVIEVLEDVPRDTEVLAGCRRLVRNGYTLALDDYVWGDDDPLLRLASIVKLDILALARDQLVEAVRHCSPYGVELVAEKVETLEQLKDCRALGFDLYQGYVLSRPEVVAGRALLPNKLICLRVLQELCDPGGSATQVEGIVRSDAALSYRFLRAAGAGAARGLFRPLGSVREAVVLLGVRRVGAWVMLMLLAGAHDGSDEQLEMAMTRARMAELMALVVEPRLSDSAFTVGLLSALDLLLRAPLTSVLEGLSLSTEIEDALLGHVGVLGGVLADVLAWEVGGERFEPCSGLALSDVEECYLQALPWANEVCWVLDVTR
jgi:EAL and modified HD-GYP domain-containing signal transduction protein